MSRGFKIYPKKILGVIMEYTSIIKELKKDILQLEIVKNDLDGASYGVVKGANSEIEAQLSDHCKNLEELRDGLRNIILAYVKSERKIVDLKLEASMDFSKDSSIDSGIDGNSKVDETSEFINSTKDYLISQEGIWRTAVQSGAKYSIGYGMDFTKESHPDLYQKYVTNKQPITDQEAYDLLDPIKNKKMSTYIDEIDKLIKTNNISLNQNQYDALFSFYYNNGAYVFSDEAYNNNEIKRGRIQGKGRSQTGIEKLSY